jgi:DHA2 family integral membrane protein (MFS transporter)
MDDEQIHKRRWAILSVLMLCLLVVVLDNTILNVALKTIQSDLDASQSQMQWAVDSYALVFAGLLITWGVLGDRLGRRRILLLGLLVFGVTSALCSFASSPMELIVFRGLMGIGAAAVQPQTLSIITNVFEPAERPKAIGIWAGASGVAIALGPVAGGLLLKYFWWGSIFLVNVPIVIIALVAAWFLVPESKNRFAGRLDPAGVLLSVVALVALVYGVIQGGNTNHWLTWDAAGAIGLGTVLLAVFVVLQHRSTHPTIDVRLFTNRGFSAGVGAIAITFFALNGSSFFLAYYLQVERGYTPLAAGIAGISIAIALTIAAPLSSRLSGRFGPRMVAGAGLTLLALALLSYAFTTRTTPIWVLEIQMAAIGAGVGLTMSPSTTAIMSTAPREKAGSVSAVNNTVRQVAGALGVAVLGSILALSFRSHLGADTPDRTAAALDQPAAIVRRLPPGQQVRSFADQDASQSVGNALEFAQQASGALRERATGPAAATATPAQKASAEATDKAVLGGFVEESKSSFMSAMRVTSAAGGGFALLGALIAFGFLPGRRAYLDSMGGPASAPAPAAVAEVGA